MHFFYNLSIYLYLFAVRGASLFNSKAVLWVAGRKNLFPDLQLAIAQADASKIAWVHCASLGEFEQGRPLIEKIRVNHPEVKILLTFFSPSGYEIRKDYKGADWVYYLPIDTPANAKAFVEIVKPVAVFFIKYEFWFNFLNELKNKNVPTYLVSGIFRRDHYFFKSYGGWFRKQLICFTYFYLQNEESQQLLNSAGFINTTVCGDTRFDRVAAIAEHVKSISLIEQFRQDKKIFIAGSTWKEDEQLIADCILKIADYKLIIVPHEISAAHIESIILKFNNFKILKFSDATELNIGNAEILLIDNIGMLSSIYQYGTIAFIGGGFGKGIHNILEAATFGLPVIFGPNYEKFTEAKELIKAGGAFSVNNTNELEKTISLLNDIQVVKTASHISKYYVQSRVGATGKILDSVKL